MIVRIAIVALLVFLGIPAFGSALDVSHASSHRELLKACYDLSWTKQNWNAESWHIRCIFADIDGNGTEELLSASTAEEEDRVGYVWKVWDLDKQEGFRPLQWSGDLYFLCHQDSFFRMAFMNRPHKILGLGMYAGHLDDTRRNLVDSTPDCIFTLIGNDKFMLTEIKPNIDSVFISDDTVSIERLYPEWYFGFDFKPPENKPHSPYLQRMPYRLPIGNLTPGGGMGAPEEFRTFVEEYRGGVRRLRGHDGAIDVYAVFLDADNDGDADCYVSSNAEQIGDGRYNWTLFLQDDICLAKADKAVSPAPADMGCGMLPPTVAAGKGSFCRVIRYDIPPSFLILNNTMEDRTVVRDTAMTYCVHRIEKLQCETFPE